MNARILPIAAACLLIGACSLFSRTKSEFYTLSSRPPSGPVATLQVPRIAIEGIELPPGLDRRGIVVHASATELEIRETEQWTSTLETMVLHTLAHDLAARLPEGTMVLPGQPRPEGAILPVSVMFDELAPGPEPVFVLDARWSAGGDVIRHERVEVPMASLESAEVATAMSAALATLADRIVAAIE